MHIQSYGFSCLKITAKPEGRGGADVTIVINPFSSKVSTLRPPQMAAADIALMSATGDQYWSDLADKSAAIPVVMPGEYAIKGVQIVGVAVPDATEGLPTATAYTVAVEGVTLGVVAGHLGALGPKQFDELSAAQVLIVAAGGQDSIAPSVAADIVRKVEPQFVIPVHCAEPGVAATRDWEPPTALAGILGAPIIDAGGKWIVRDKDCAEATAVSVVLLSAQA